MNIVRTFAILRFKICHSQFRNKNPKKLKLKSNFKTIWTDSKTQYFKFHKIATFVRKKVYINTEKNQKKISTISSTSSKYAAP